MDTPPPKKRKKSRHDPCIDGTSKGAGQNGKNKVEQGAFTTEQTLILRAWLLSHFDNPYPSLEEKQLLSTACGLPFDRLSIWFVNHRMRDWKPAMRQRREGMTGDLLKTPAQKLHSLHPITSLPVDPGPQYLLLGVEGRVEERNP